MGLMVFIPETVRAGSPRRNIESTEYSRAHTCTVAEPAGSLYIIGRMPLFMHALSGKRLAMEC